MLPGAIDQQLPQDRTWTGPRIKLTQTPPCLCAALRIAFRLWHGYDDCVVEKNHAKAFSACKSLVMPWRGSNVADTPKWACTCSAWEWGERGKGERPLSIYILKRYKTTKDSWTRISHEMHVVIMLCYVCQKQKRPCNGEKKKKTKTFSHKKSSHTDKDKPIITCRMGTCIRIITVFQICTMRIWMCTYQK